MKTKRSTLEKIHEATVAIAATGTGDEEQFTRAHRKACAVAVERAKLSGEEPQTSTRGIVVLHDLFDEHDETVLPYPDARVVTPAELRLMLQSLVVGYYCGLVSVVIHLGGLELTEAPARESDDQRPGYLIVTATPGRHATTVISHDGKSYYRSKVFAAGEKCLTETLRDLWEIPGAQEFAERILASRIEEVTK